MIEVDAHLREMLECKIDILQKANISSGCGLFLLVFHGFVNNSICFPQPLWSSVVFYI